MSSHIAGLCVRNVGSRNISLLLSRFPSHRRLTPAVISRSRTAKAQFEPLVPPTPESLGKAAPPKQYRRSLKWGRRLLYFSVGVGTVYLIDTQFNESSFTRSFRTFWNGLVVAIDYKVNFREKPYFGGSIENLHRRSAERLFDLLCANGGLYLKIGQALAMQSAVMPPEFQKMFQRMFDDAPQNSWKDVERVIREDFGKSPEEVFGISFTGEPGKGVMEKAARASASVAQVHWAKLADGREVAIKIQKREIAKQVGWDLWTFKVVMWIYTKVFDLPMYNIVPFITQRLMLETDFENEADNSEKMAKFVAGEPRLKERVYIPKVYRDLSSKRVMTAEWIEGVRLWDKKAITAPWLGGRGKPSPGVHGAPLDDPTKPLVFEELRSHPNAEKLKPERNHWRGPNGKGGLGLSLKEVMTTMVDLFSAQMFLWGLVHCDPHPGNIFIRRLANGHSELVLIDHGLYVNMSPKFRHDYSLFWKSLLTFDNKTLAKITEGWGVREADLFASATLMRPYEGGDQKTKRNMMEDLKASNSTDRGYAMQRRGFQNMRDVLSDEDKWPRELIFIARNMRIVQGNNQFLGSPVNRIKMTGMWASRALVDSPDLTYRERVANGFRHVIFRMVLFTSDLVFWTSKVRQWFGWGQGMEDDLEKQMRRVAKESFGVELQHDVFQG